MASVRMTRDLQNTIRRNAEEAYSVANPRPAPSEEMVQFTRDALMNAPHQQWAKKSYELALEHDIPGHFGQYDYPRPSKDTDKTVTAIELRAKSDQESRWHHNNYHEVRLPLQTPITDYIYPQDGGRYYGASVPMYIENARPEDQTQLREYFDAFRKADQEYSQKRVAYESSISDLVIKCTTLKQLLEVWPAAESLVPPSAIQKLHTKVSRKQRAAAIKEEVCFDPTIANQAVLTAKMLGG